MEGKARACSRSKSIKTLERKLFGNPWDDLRTKFESYFQGFYTGEPRHPASGKRQLFLFFPIFTKSIVKIRHAQALPIWLSCTPTLWQTSTTEWPKVSLCLCFWSPTLSQVNRFQQKSSCKEIQKGLISAWGLLRAVALASLCWEWGLLQAMWNGKGSWSCCVKCQARGLGSMQFFSLRSVPKTI